MKMEPTCQQSSSGLPAIAQIGIFALFATVLLTTWHHDKYVVTIHICLIVVYDGTYIVDKQEQERDKEPKVNKTTINLFKDDVEAITPQLITVITKTPTQACIKHQAVITSFITSSQGTVLSKQNSRR